MKRKDDTCPILPKYDPETFALIRKAIGLSQEKLADAIGMSRQTIVYVEHGIRSNEPTVMLIGLALDRIAHSRDCDQLVESIKDFYGNKQSHEERN